MKIIAHRGASGYRPEQTMAAYELAADQDADGWECDIRLTADNEVVCFHDSTVNRVSDGQGAVADMTLADLRALDVGAGQPERAGGRRHSVVTLRELITFTMDRRAGLPDTDGPELFIETKNSEQFGGQLEALLNRELHRAGIDRAPFVHVISFSPRSLDRFHRINPAVNRILLRRQYRMWVPLPLPRGLRGGDSGRHEVGTAGCDAGYGVLRARLRPRAVDTRAGRAYLFTANREEDVRWAARHNVGWLATDVPDRALAWRDDSAAVEFRRAGVRVHQ
ncbi:glycerophosphodiester phosphodiesterase [Corynebacterium bovis]|uniref:glycerophosphodiester phosphodiesterase n=1 Tax=Corynebacterium bovis TaxID=36808 RepID=UPI00313A00C1